MSGRLKDTAISAAVGGAAVPALEAVSKVATAAPRVVGEGTAKIRKGFGTKTAEEWKSVGDDLAASADSTLQAANKAGTIVSQPAAAKGIDGILSDMKFDELAKRQTSQSLYGGTMDVMRDLKAMKGKTVTLDEIHEMRQLIGQTISKGLKTQGATQDAAKSSQLLQKFDDWVEGLKPEDLTAGSTENVSTLYDYLGQYSLFKRFDDVRKIVEASGGDVNKVRTDLKGWFRPGNDKKLRGFSDEQKKVLHAIAYPSKGEQVLNLIGKGGIDLSNPQNHWLGPFINLTIAGGTHGLSSGGASVVAATAARSAGQRMARGNIETALEALARGEKPVRISVNPNNLNEAGVGR
jgi:hypothetical protein